MQLGFRAHLRVLEAVGFLKLKYAFSHILETLSRLFPKTDKNRTSHSTSISLGYHYVITHSAKN